MARRYRGSDEGSAPAHEEHWQACLPGLLAGGAYALDMSVREADQVAAVVIFYDSYPGLEYRKASAAYLLHYAQNDQFVPDAAVTQIEQELKAAGKSVAVYRYPGTEHWFVEENRPEYNAEAAQLAWERTIDFLHHQLG